MLFNDTSGFAGKYRVTREKSDLFSRWNVCKIPEKYSTLSHSHHYWNILTAALCHSNLSTPPSQSHQGLSFLRPGPSPHPNSYSCRAPITSLKPSECTEESSKQVSIKKKQHLIHAHLTARKDDRENKVRRFNSTMLRRPVGAGTESCTNTSIKVCK